MNNLRFQGPSDSLRREAMHMIRIVPQTRRWPYIHNKGSEVSGHLLICPAACSQTGQEYTYWRPDLFHGRSQRMLLHLRRKIAARYARRLFATHLSNQPQP